MKKLVVLLLIAALPGLALAQKAKTRAPASPDCATCTQKDKKGNCTEWDFSKCKSDAVKTTYKGYKDLVTSNDIQESLIKNVFAYYNKGVLNPNWKVSGRNNGVIIIVNTKKKTSAGLSCKGGCNLRADNGTIQCAKSDKRIDCRIKVVSTLSNTPVTAD